VGKTTLAQALARSLGLAFQRIQFTSDLLPSDIIGVSVYNRTEERFEFSSGPIFANVVLADEINRASPKTQSALLEAMSERQVTVDGTRYRLPDPFIVLATQNPLEYVGTFPLPESQLDRFLMSIEIGYPPAADERELLLSGGVDDMLETMTAVVSEREFLSIQRNVPQVRVAEKLADYILAIARETREAGDFLLGISTRGAQSLFRATQARALCEGRTYAVPDDVQAVAPSVLAHRVVLRGNTGDMPSARRAVRDLLSRLPVPI
jgi:MoxR-like ATPase